MSKQAKSQWDFGGELFPVEHTRRVLTVGELTEQIRRLLEKQVGSIWVTGEVTNLRVQSSGHIYFTLKDANAQLSCVLFRNEPVAHRELLADGQKLLLQGEVTVYETRGQYQLIVRALELQGVGALQIKFEQLKSKLAGQGLFAPERKRPLPRFPQRIGLVTSPTGAAIRDVLHVIQRRNPSLEIVFAPCCVQGDGAGREIAAGIQLLNRYNVTALQDRSTPLDLILITRGGGSIEDLWAFNEEIVAHAIFESVLPIVSAVGHEIDFTIADFVADLRAATPSAAAEIITEGVFSCREFVRDSPQLMGRCVNKQMTRALEDFENAMHRLSLAHPRRRINESLQRRDDLQTAVVRSAKQGLRERKTARRELAERLLRVRPAQTLKQHRDLLEERLQRFRDAGRQHLRNLKTNFATNETRLRLLGPEQVLGRGYSITMEAESGKIIRDSSALKTGQKIRTRLKKGEVSSKVENI
jgi:exodeoxyribonuclease VII large subunit